MNGKVSAGTGYDTVKDTWLHRAKAAALGRTGDRDLVARSAVRRDRRSGGRVGLTRAPSR